MTNKITNRYQGMFEVFLLQNCFCIILVRYICQPLFVDLINASTPTFVYLNIAFPQISQNNQSLTCYFL